jgi:hypothetical protein
VNQQTYDSNPELIKKIKALGGNIRIDADLPDGVIVLDDVVMPVGDAYRVMLGKAIEAEKERLSKHPPIRRYSIRNEKRLRRKQLRKQEKLQEGLKRMEEMVKG